MILDRNKLSIQLDSFFLGKDFYYNKFTDSNNNKIKYYANNLYGYVYPEREKNKKLLKINELKNLSMLVSSPSFVNKYLDYKKTYFYYPSKHKSLKFHFKKFVYFLFLRKKVFYIPVLPFKSSNCNYTCYSFGYFLFSSKRLFPDYVLSQVFYDFLKNGSIVSFLNSPNFLISKNKNCVNYTVFRYFFSFISLLLKEKRSNYNIIKKKIYKKYKKMSFLYYKFLNNKNKYLFRLYFYRLFRSSNFFFSFFFLDSKFSKKKLYLLFLHSFFFNPKGLKFFLIILRFKLKKFLQFEKNCLLYKNESFIEFFPINSSRNS